MTCHHQKGDPDCGRTTPEQKVAFFERKVRECAEGEVTYRDEYRRASNALVSAYGGSPAPDSPDPDDYEIIEIEQVEDHLVVKVQYPSCKNCAFGACKVLVYLDTKVVDAVHWRHVDPHFTDAAPSNKSHAPAPRARFPADGPGWEDAIDYARSKAKETPVRRPKLTM